MQAIDAGFGPQRRRSRRALIAILLAYSLVLHTVAFAFAHSPATAGVLIDQVICSDPGTGPSRDTAADLGIAPTHKHGAVCLLCLAGNLTLVPTATAPAIAFVWRRAPTDPVRAERPYASPSPERGLHARAPPAAV